MRTPPIRHHAGYVGHGEHKAAAICRTNGPVGWNRRWVSHRRMREDVMTTPGALHFHALMIKSLASGLR